MLGEGQRGGAVSVPQPMVTAVCTNEDCPAYGAEDRVLAWVEFGQYDVMVDEDAWCPECHIEREIRR